MRRVRFLKQTKILKRIILLMESQFSDKCTGLPSEISIWSIKTDIPLPVDHGTKVEMDCIPGYSLLGSRVITCVKGRNWEFETTPECILGKIHDIKHPKQHFYFQKHLRFVQNLTHLSDYPSPSAISTSERVIIHSVDFADKYHKRNLYCYI